MRLLPYSKRLIERRAAGERPWLVVVEMGRTADRKISRLALASLKDTAVIWAPEDFDIAQADLTWAVGLDVLVFWLEWSARVDELCWALWRARVATLWLRHCKTEINPRNGQWHDNYDKFTASLLTVYKFFLKGTEFSISYKHQVPLDESFRPLVARVREQALMCAAEPLFQDPLFSAERQKLLAVA